MSNGPRGEWTPGVFKMMLRRQISDLEKARTQLQRKGKTADDDPELMDLVLELRAFRKTLAEWEEELQGDSTDIGQSQ